MDAMTSVPIPSHPTNSGPRFGGTLPGWAIAADRNPVLAFVDSCLRGVGQVVLLNNPLSGAMILIALFLADLQLGVLASMGLVASTLTASMLRLERAQIRAGLYGYNGLLVGAAMAAFLVPRWGGALFLATIVGAIGSTIVCVAVAAIAQDFDLPALTFPFNLVTIPLLWATFAGTQVGRGPALEERALVAPIDPLLRALESGSGAFGTDAFLNALVRGISQLFLADGLLTGVLIVLALGIASPIAMGMALLGSAIGSAAGIALGADGYDIYHGLWGFNSFITAVAIGGFFFVPTWRSVVYAAAAAVAAALLHGGLSVIFARWGVPSLTLPFCIVTIVFLLVRGATPVFRAVPLALITTPEAHRSLPAANPRG